MFKFLNVDSPFFKTLNTMTNYLILGVTYIISCLPIITIGAASTAMYITHHKVIENDEGYIWKTYWQQFRSNFKQATLLWLIMLLFTAFLAFDCYITHLYRIRNHAMTYLFVAMVALSIVFITWMRYWFPYIAHVEDPIGRVLKNTLIMCIIHLPQSICIALIYALCIAIVLFLPMSMLLISLVFSPILYVWLSYKPFTKVFINYWDMSDGHTGEKTEEE